MYSDTPSVMIHLKFRILSRLIWVHLFWKNNHQKTHACNKNPLTQPHCMGSSVKDKDYCPIEIIKGLTDKGHFQYLTKLMGPQEGTYLYATQFHSLR